MAEETVRIQLGEGEEVEAVRRKPVQASEPWAEYVLDDGSTVRLKPVLVDVFRVKDRYDDEGNPIYQLVSKAIIDVRAPEELRKPKS